MSGCQNSNLRPPAPKQGCRFDKNVDTLFKNYVETYEPLCLALRALCAYSNVIKKTEYNLELLDNTIMDPRFLPYMKSKQGGTKIYAQF